MSILIGIVLGLLWGTAFAFINYEIMKRAVSGKSTNAVLGVSAARTAIDAVCLGCVFLVRNVPFIHFAAAIISAAAALSITTIYFTYKIAGTKE